MGSTARLYEQFLGFYGNPAIGTLADAARWTVSGRLGDPGGRGKVPIDMRALLDIGRVRGAWTIGEECLVTLRELTERLPDAANHAFYLRAQTDGLMVVDIEPDCPAEIAANLLGLPGLVYTETSMSGRGYHLMTALPENFYDHTVASSKRVLREEHGWYELLLDHWVTFTRQPIGKGVLARAGETGRASAPFASIEGVYASLAAKVKASPGGGVTAVPTSGELPEINGGQQIVERTLDGARPRLKQLGDFADDHSRWEFSVLGTLFREMHHHLVVIGFLRRTSYSASDQAWLLYQAALAAIPSRAKHHERRNGQPFLLDRAAAMVAANSQ
ncbi:hypothetical protein SCMU_00450 [Sinomonas cyclohexanicum]|uniref:DNA primase/polymerase bifunctional N-terminal domain-containing protein n=1 Tax=Sinomonas cyclohexanicum TaxID=322009 RepID=A0ABN6FBQ2_SINCY|nr:hypothetical protein [Corynebacterium cyclohexanicum]BCT74203.1 hypothetical protein SCMU_00450 [Corynebacterium cyclohexanicum]